jgi:hypothetical protein
MAGILGPALRLLREGFVTVTVTGTGTDVD